MYDDLYSRTRPYFANVQLISATFLDPRYRSFKFIKEAGDLDKKLFEAKSYIKTLFRSNLGNKNATNSTQSAEPPFKRFKSSENQKYSLLCVESDDSDLSESNDDTKKMKPIVDELMRYQRIKVQDINETSCPLSFFFKYNNELPNLAVIAKQVLCTPATSTPSESLFSSAGQTITDLRNNLDPELAEMLIMLQENNSI
jgi:zinc finger BED domain-containing protein 1 (E3 SUMO-protein ligase ZBED1)